MFWSAGEQVLLLLPDCTKKFLRKWQGPFTVKRRIGQVNYEIVMDNQGHTKVFHFNLLKKWHSRVADQEPCSYLCLEEEEDGGLTDRGSSGHKLEIITGSNLTARQSKQLHELLEQFPRVLSTQTGKTTLINHHILTTDCAPIWLRPYKIPHAYREEVLKELNELEKAGIIQESDSSWAAPIAVVKKKDGRLRICVDYRKLNQVTQVDAYPMPRIDDLLDSVGQSTYIATLDLAKRYWQVSVAPEDRPKTAFTTPKGLFEFTTMPFGLQGAPATFQRLRDRFIRGTEEFCRSVSRLCHDSQFKLEWASGTSERSSQQVKSSRTKLSNCVFGTEKCENLGHKIGQGGISPLKSKVVAVREMPRPQTKKEIRTFLGMTGYYRIYIQNYASIAATFSDLTRKCMPDKIVWTDQTQQVFDTLKTALTSSTVMRNLDPKQTFILLTDASNIWVGAVLSQGQEEHLIAYFSRNCLTWRGIIQLLRRSAVQLYCQSSTSMCICWESHLSYKLITKH